MATQPTLSIKAGDIIQLSIRRIPQSLPVLSVVASVNSSGLNQYAVTTSMGVFDITPSSTVLGSVNQGGINVWVVGR